MAKPKPTATQPPDNNFWRATVPCALLALAALLIFVARVRLAGAPLERDEGEYAYMGQLMLQGIPPYSIAANMKFPGVSVVYALVMAVFGQSVTAIHLGLLLCNIATVALLYLLARRLFPAPAAIAAAAAFTILSSGWSVMGMWAHATHYVMLPAVAGFYLLLQWRDSGKQPTLLWAGFLLGLSILMKQHGVFFVAFAAGCLLWQRRWKETALFTAASTLPFLLMCALLARAGVMDKFWFWTISYAREYATATSLSAGMKMLADSVRYITLANWTLWIAAAGAWFAWREQRWLLFLFFGVSFLAVCPGFYFRDHYFILLLPAVSLFIAVAARPGWHIWAITAAALFSVIEQREFLFQADPVVATTAVYGANPFPEAQQIANYIRAHSANGDQIAVLGSEPEIFFYANRQSATPYIYAYPLMEAHPYARKMQEDFIHDLETKRPKFVVMVNVATSWLRAQDSADTLLNWWATKGRHAYHQIGAADILPEGTKYEWNATYHPRSPAHLLLLTLN